MTDSVQTVRVEALLVGERIRTIGLGPKVAAQPLLIEVAGGHAVVFRYGAVVLFGLSEDERRHFLASLQERVVEPYDRPESEVLEIEVARGSDERVSDGLLTLAELTPGRRQTIAEVLGKSVVLGSFEARMAVTFGSVEPLAEELRKRGRYRAHGRSLLQHIGEGLLIEHKLVGLAEVGDKPELLWDEPDLERLYVRLADEYELTERTAALERKLVLVRTTVETVLELLNDKRILRVEWYIVILIVFEILLTLYSMFIAGNGH